MPKVICCFSLKFKAVQCRLQWVFSLTAIRCHFSGVLCTCHATANSESVYLKRLIFFLIDLFFFVPRRKHWQQVQVADLVASVAAALLHRPKLCQAPLGEILHVVLPSVHPVDRHLLLLHGLDGESSLHRFSFNKKKKVTVFHKTLSHQCCMTVFHSYYFHLLPYLAVQANNNKPRVLCLRPARWSKRSLRTEWWQHTSWCWV